MGKCPLDKIKGNNAVLPAAESDVEYIYLVPIFHIGVVYFLYRVLHELFKQIIEYAFRRQRELKRAVPLAAFGEIKYCAFISMPGIIQYPIQEQIDYAYAAASRNEKIPVMWISLEYDDKTN